MPICLILQGHTRLRAIDFDASQVTASAQPMRILAPIPCLPRPSAKQWFLWGFWGAYRDYDDHCTVVVVIRYAPKYNFQHSEFRHMFLGSQRRMPNRPDGNPHPNRRLVQHLRQSNQIERRALLTPCHTPTWEPGETHRNKKILRILTLFSSNHGLLVPIMDPIMDFLWGSAPWNMVVGSTKNMIKSWRNKILCKSVPKTESSYKQTLARRVI